MTISNITPHSTCNYYQTTDQNYNVEHYEQITTSFLQLKIQPDEPTSFAFFTDLPEDLLTRIFSYLSNYQAFICHAVCTRFFANAVVSNAREQLCNSIVTTFRRQPSKNFNLLTQELKKAVSVLDYTRHGRNIVSLSVVEEAAQFPNTHTISALIGPNVLSSSNDFQSLLSFSCLKTLHLSDVEIRKIKGNNASYHNLQGLSLLSKPVENLVFTMCLLTDFNIKQICCITSLQSLVIRHNFTPNIGLKFIPSSFSQLPVTLKELQLPDDDFLDVSHISHLKNLQILHLRALHTTHNLSQLPTSLTQLHVSKYCEEEAPFKQLCHLENLKVFKIERPDKVNEFDLPEWMTSLWKKCSTSDS